MFHFFLFCKLAYEVSANIAPLFYIRTPCYSMSSAFSLPYHPMLNYIVWQDMMIEDFACQVISRNFYYLFPVSDLLFYHQNTIQFIIWNMIEQKYILTWCRILKNWYLKHVSPNAIQYLYKYICEFLWNATLLLPSCNNKFYSFYTFIYRCNQNIYLCVIFLGLLFSCTSLIIMWNIVCIQDNYVLLFKWLHENLVNSTEINNRMGDTSITHTDTYYCEIALTIVGVPSEQFIWFFRISSSPQNYTKLRCYCLKSVNGW